MKRLVLVRLKDDGRETVGDLYVYAGNSVILTLKTLELPWRNNERSVSCIPAGRYSVVPRSSDSKGRHFQVLGVNGRDMILIHKGNYFTDTLGCILVGTQLVDINGDKSPDTTNSGVAMSKLLEALAGETSVQFDIVGV